MQLLFLYRELEFRYILEEAKYLELYNQISWDRIYSAAVFLYRELEFCYHLEEAKYLELSNQYFCDRVYSAVVVLYDELDSATAWRKTSTWIIQPVLLGKGLQYSCYFCTWRWNYATSWRKPIT